jgi:transcriptional regulator with XRE-family HTH domain
MSKTIGHPDDADFKQDLDIVARKLPGKGAALQRMIERAGVTQKEIAEAVKVDRTAISQWISEKKWMKSRRLLDVLTFLQVDRKLLSDAASILIGAEMGQNVFQAGGGLNLLEVTQETMVKMLSGRDDFEQLDLIFTTFAPHVTLSVALKAAGKKGAESCDPRAAKQFFDEWRLHQEEKRLRGLREARNVTPDQLKWLKGMNRSKDETPASGQEDGLESERDPGEEFPN